MPSHIIKHIWLSLALIAAFVQSFGTSGLRIAEVEGFNTVSFICATPDKNLSQEAINAGQELAQLLGIDTKHPDPEQNIDHCSDCVVPGLAILKPNAAQDIAIKMSLAVPVFFKNPAQFAYKTRGPPLGGRAPPIFV